LDKTKRGRGLTARSFFIAWVLLILSVFWVRDVELLSFTCQITESVPPIPAIAVALLMGLLLPLVSKLGIGTPSKQEQGVIYVFVAIGCVMSGVGVAQAILPYMTVLDYFASPENAFAAMRDAVPSWVGPRDPEVVRTFFEGSSDGTVPWRHWLPPLSFWSLFLLSYWTMAVSLWCVFRRQWMETERLTFPLLYIPLSMIGRSEEGKERKSFVGNKLFWTGFGVSFVYNALNILHAFNPSVAAVGVMYPIGHLFTEKPLNALAGVQMWHRPELIGFGYLMSQDILQSVWGSFLLQRSVSVLGNTLGSLRAGFPYEGEQGLGGYMVMGLFLVWSAREHLKSVARKALSGTGIDDSREPLPYRWAVAGLLLGFGGIVAMSLVLGVHPFVAFPFFLVLLCFVFVYARIRAETGTPSVWIMSHGFLNQLPFYAFGSEVLRIGGSIRTMSALSHLFFLCHAGFFGQMSVYSLESFKLSDALRSRRKEMVATAYLALGAGLLLAFWMFLKTYYGYGANVLAGGAGTGTGGGRIHFCFQAFWQVAQYIEHPRPMDRSRDLALWVGAVAASSMLAARVAWLRFPLHPLGYLMACTWGANLWWAFFLAWAAKKTILHMGGVKLYQRLIPFFVGLALGHFFTVGVVWASIAKLWPHVEFLIWFV